MVVVSNTYKQWIPSSLIRKREKRGRELRWYPSLALAVCANVVETPNALGAIWMACIHIVNERERIGCNLCLQWVNHAHASKLDRIALILLPRKLGF